SFPEVEFEEDPQEEPKEEFEEDPKEGFEEDPEEDPEAEAEDDVPPPATPPVGSPITPPPLSESSSNTEDITSVIENEALKMPPIGSTYERCEKKHKVDMETCSSKIREGKKRMDKMEQGLGDEMQFSNRVENRVTDLENREQEKDEEMDKRSSICRLGCPRDLDEVLRMHAQIIMPPKMMKRKAVNKMIEKLEQVFEICKCAEEDKVMFAASTFEGRALTWWNGNVCTLGLVNANRIPWTEFKSMMTTKYCPATEIQRMEEELWMLTLKGDDIEAYNNRFHELALMCPDLVPNEKKKIERYMKGFPKRIKGNITSSRPTTLHEAVNLARELVEQAVQGKAVRANENNKRRWEEHQRNHPNNNNPNNLNRNRNNNNNTQYHQQNRRQETARAYAAAPAEGKTYAGNLPKCNWDTLDTSALREGTNGTKELVQEPMWWLKTCRKIRMWSRIVRIPLPNGEILKIHGERPEKDSKSLSCIKADEVRLDDIRTICEFPEVFSDDLTEKRSLAPIAMIVTTGNSANLNYGPSNRRACIQRCDDVKGDFVVKEYDCYEQIYPALCNEARAKNLVVCLIVRAVWEFFVELLWIFVREKMSRDVITVGSTMRILLLYRGEYSQWRERFMNYLEEQTYGEAMINSIQGDQPLPVIAQVSLAGNAQNAPPTLKDLKFWTAEEKKTRKINRLARCKTRMKIPSNLNFYKY
nr:hypothetical protein [Tanacetum cinerariifolium]